MASYCRVSTDRDDQANSFESQQRYFSEYIEKHPQWELYEIYADEGISGTSTKKRTQFNRMIHDAYSGKFKLIITKEVSRFSRNLLDTISYTRELKRLGIGVVFMNDGFCSLDPDSELRLSIMGSIAQEESRKTSSRVKWGQTRQMERGVVFGTSLLGYNLCNGKMSINPQEAEIVRLIFQKYGIEKKGTSLIARELQEAGYKNHRGNPIWSRSHIIKILHNEKYVGDLIQKKTITPDYLSHSKKYNKGQEDLIILRNHHEPIIDRDLWDTVQIEITKRSRNHSEYSGNANRYTFSGKIICAECGSRFVARKKKRNNGTSYIRWCCYTATTLGTKKTDIHGYRVGCDIGKTIRDDLFIQVIVQVIKSMPIDFQWIIQNLTNVVNTAIHADHYGLDNLQKLENQIQNVLKRKENAIDAYLSGIITQEELTLMKDMYDKSLTSLKQRLQTCQAIVKGTQQQVIYDMHDLIAAFVLCDRPAKPLYKALLEKIIIRKDGIFQVHIQNLPLVWYFELLYSNKALGCHSNPSVPISVSRPFNSSNGML